MANEIPRGATPSKCRSCGAEIWWVTTEADKDMPLNPGPRADGNIVIENARAVHFDTSNLFHGQLARFVSHFVTCPQADWWRRAREARR